MACQHGILMLGTSLWDEVGPPKPDLNQLLELTFMPYTPWRPDG